MSLNFPLLKITRIAVLAIAPHRICKPGGSDGTAAQAESGTDSLIGVTGPFEATDGERIELLTSGIVPVEYGGNVSYGDRLTSDAQGRAVVATEGQSSIGVAFEDGDEGTIGSLLISQVSPGSLASVVAAAPAFAAGDLVVPDNPASGTVFKLPATAANSTVTLPATAPVGTLLFFSGDGTANGHTVQYRDATGPTNLTTALTASKRHLVIAIKLTATVWVAIAYTSP